MVKILHDHTKENILVLSYTNHALDQMVADIQKAGIPASSIIRLGGRSNASTQALSMYAQLNDYKMSGQTYAMIQDQKAQAESYHDALSAKIKTFADSRINEQGLLEYLEFSEDSEFFDAFALPDNGDGMKRVGKKNKQVNKTYLIERWIPCKDPGMFQSTLAHNYPHVWNMEPITRENFRTKWMREVVEGKLAEIGTLAKAYNDCYSRVQELFHKKDSYLISNKRIVACTTTGAAKFREDLRKAAPGIVLVEEAGEILESHILTALTTATKQLILIGDHKQLRPKVNNYTLTAEKGEGYDLNVSMFERLVLAGVPHITLTKQWVNLNS